ncbi:MAG TPA: ISAs1 family transposase, partial [Pseudonocardiaceae bacterium]|nr:ISAs1 family transposase [Pseudonocardiaceae bacterium]
MAWVEDPRARRGVRHGFVAVVGVGVCAVLAGARTFTAIAEWAHDLTPAVRVRLGLGRKPPSESTIRRVLQAVDAEALDQAVSAWLVTRSAPSATALRMIAIDGKSAHGTRGADGRAVHLLAAFDQASGIVLGQTVVDGKTNEINAFVPLLDRIDITGAIITADALHTQHRHADYLIGRGAHYVLTVKRNQPSLHRQLATLPWAQVPAVDLTHDKGHGRIESRSLKLAAVPAGIAFPHAYLAIQLTRRRRPLSSGKWHTETVYAITDMTWAQIRADHLAEAIRGHWGIENRLHWIRDVVFAEDHSQIRTGTGPAVMATLRNLAVSLHRLTGATNIAAACRHVSRHPNPRPATTD